MTPEELWYEDEIMRRMTYYSGSRSPEVQHRLDAMCPYADDPLCCSSPEACRA